MTELLVFASATCFLAVHGPFETSYGKIQRAQTAPWNFIKIFNWIISRPFVHADPVTIDPAVLVAYD